MTTIYWEPWNPRVGDRVTTRVSPECRTRFRFYTYGGKRRTSEDLVDHRTGFSDLTGIVRAVARSEVGKSGLPREGHYYLVAFDRRVSHHGRWVQAGAFAAVELDPLPPLPSEGVERPL